MAERVIVPERRKHFPKLSLVDHGRERLRAFFSQQAVFDQSEPRNPAARVAARTPLRPPPCLELLSYIEDVAVQIAIRGEKLLFVMISGDELCNGFVAGILRRKIGLGRTARRKIVLGPAFLRQDER